jgi:hypothetical protein
LVGSSKKEWIFDLVMVCPEVPPQLSLGRYYSKA